METRQGKIEEKNLKFATNKAPYATFTIGGLKYNSFDKEIVDNHNPDDFVEFTGEQEGKFWALKTMKKIDKPMEECIDLGPVKKNDKEYHLSPEEVKCRALECAIESIKGNIFSKDEFFEVADKFVEWIYGS